MLNAVSDLLCYSYIRSYAQYYAGIIAIAKASCMGTCIATIMTPEKVSLI